MKKLANSYTLYKLEGVVKSSLFDQSVDGFVITRDGFNSVISTQTIRINLSSQHRDLTPVLVAKELGLNPDEFETLRFYKDEINRSGL